ncbi:MAG: NAD-binding protein [Candidatus Aenigmarchaeota archaeon]|nr:NAD-binding protein [Candidatus Aenigmarchaeota archaeon]
MRFIIVGGGTFGRTLGENLAESKHDVVLIEKEEKIAKEVAEDFNGKVINGNGTEEDTLDDAGIDKSDFFVTTTGTDETNLLACMVAKGMSNIKLATRVTKEGYKKIFEEAGINIIVSPEITGAEELEFMITEPDVLTIASTHKGGVSLLEMKVESKSRIKGMKIGDIEEDNTFRLVSIKRKDKFLIPTDETKIEAGDSIIVIAKKRHESKIMGLFK